MLVQVQNMDLYEQKCVNRRSPPIPERESPVEAGLIRVYGQWDNYRTNFDDFWALYLLGIQVDNRLIKEPER